MAKVSSHNVRVYIGGYDVSPSATRVGVSLVTQALDPTALVDTGERALAGNRQDAFEFEGLFSDVDHDFDYAQKALLGDGTAVVSVHLGTAVGDIAYAGTALLAAAKAPARIGELVRQEATFKPDDALHRGIAMTPGTLTVGTTGYYGSNDNGADTFNGATWYFHALGTAGTGTAAVRIETSDDGTSYSMLFHQGGVTANKSYRLTTTGTIQQYSKVRILSLQQTSLTLASVFVRH